VYEDYGLTPVASDAVQFWNTGKKAQLSPPVEQTEEQLRESVLKSSGTPWYAYPGEVLAGVPRGAVRATGMAIEGVGRIAEQEHGIDPDVLGLIGKGQSLQRFAEKTLPVAPDMEGGITQAISEGVGSVLPAAASFAAGGRVGIAAFGGAAAYSGTYNQSLQLAEAAGLKGKDAQSAARNYARVSALVTGITEPFGAAARGIKILKRLDDAAGKWIGKAIGKAGGADDAAGKWIGKEIGKAGGAEALQEGLQEIPDEVARQAYIKERNLIDSLMAVGGAAALGGTVGVIFGGLVSAPAMIRAIRETKRTDATGFEQAPSPAPPLAPGEQELYAEDDPRSIVRVAPEAAAELLRINDAAVAAGKDTKTPGMFVPKSDVFEEITGEKKTGKERTAIMQSLLQERDNAISQGAQQESGVGQRTGVGEVGPTTEAGGRNLVEEGGQVEEKRAAVLGSNRIPSDVPGLIGEVLLTPEEMVDRRFGVTNRFYDSIAGDSTLSLEIRKAAYRLSKGNGTNEDLKIVHDGLGAIPKYAQMVEESFPTQAQGGPVQEERTAVLGRPLVKPVKPQAVSGLEKTLRESFKNYRDMIEGEQPTTGRIDPESGLPTEDVASSGYTFKQSSADLARELKERLPQNLQRRVKVVGKGHVLYAGANGADIASEIGIDAMAQAIIRNAEISKPDAIGKLIEFAKDPRSAAMLDNDTLVAIRSYEQLTRYGTEQAIKGSDLQVGDAVRIGGEDYVAKQKTDKGILLQDDVAIEIGDKQKIPIEEGSHKPAGSQRPGIFGQETFDPVTGKQGELPLAARQESQPPDVPGQQTIADITPAAKAQADAKAAWDALEAYGKSHQSLFSTGVDPQAWAMFVKAVKAEVRAKRLTFQQFMAKLIKTVGAKLAEQLRPDLRREWDAEMVAMGGRPSARPDLAKMGLTPEVRHIEDLGDIARNRIGAPGVRKDAALLAEANAELAADYDELEAQALSGEMFVEAANLDKRMVQAGKILNDKVKTGWATQNEDMILQGMKIQDNVRRSRTEAARYMRIGADKFMNPQERASFEAHNQLIALSAGEEALVDKMLAQRDKLVERRRRVVEKAAEQPAAQKPSPKPKATPQKAIRIKEATAKLDKSIRKLAALLSTPFTGGPLNPELYATIGEVVGDAVSAGLAYAELAGSLIREFGEIKYARIESAVRDAWDKATAGISAKPLTAMQQQMEGVIGAELSLPEVGPMPQVAGQPALGFVEDIDAKIVAIDKAIAARRRKWINKNQELVAELKRNGFNVDAVLDGKADMRLAGVVTREFNAGKSSYWDKQYELWVNSIFGWGTQVANISGTLYNVLKQGYVDRFVKATVDTAIRAMGLRKGGARYQELYHFTYGMIASWAKSRQNFAMTWHTEQPRFNLEHGHPETTQFEYRKAAIPAKYHGPKIRLMTRLMMAADDGAKSLAYAGQLSALAYRQAAAEDNSGDARLSRMLDLLADPHWEGREQAFDDVIAWAFQAPTKVGAGITKVARKIPGGRYKWPFMNTITNIFKTGIRDTPYGIPEFLHQIAQAKKTGDWSKVDQNFARQIVGVGTMLALAVGMDLADEWITGTRDKNRPLHWRVPFTNKWLNYGRLEPFATSLALMVDTIKDWKRAPGIGNKILAPISSLIRQVDTKWFLAGSHDLIKGAEAAFRGDPQFWVPTAEWAVKLPASFIPNWLVRGPIAAAKADVPIRRSYGKGAERAESLVKTGLRATEVYGLFGDEYPKRDLWGRSVLKDGSPLPSTDWLARMASMPTASKYKELPGDRMINAWNERHPEEPIAFGVAKRTYVVDGKTHYMTDAEYDRFLHEAGELSTQRVDDYVLRRKVNLDDPTESNMKVMREKINDSRAAVRRQIKRGARGEQAEEE
jgi:hypothetical protein